MLLLLCFYCCIHLNQRLHLRIEIKYRTRKVVFRVLSLFTGLLEIFEEERQREHSSRFLCTFPMPFSGMLDVYSSAHILGARRSIGKQSWSDFDKLSLVPTKSFHSYRIYIAFILEKEMSVIKRSSTNNKSYKSFYFSLFHPNLCCVIHAHMVVY